MDLAAKNKCLLQGTTKHEREVFGIYMLSYAIQVIPSSVMLSDVTPGQFDCVAVMTAMTATLIFGEVIVVYCVRGPVSHSGFVASPESTAMW